MIGINELAKEIHENAVKHGWWDEKRGFPEVLALIHSEVSEALEEYRNGRGAAEIYYTNSKCKESGGVCVADAADECPNDPHSCGAFEKGKPEGIPIELADVIIRILDYCGYAGIDIEAEIRQKHEYNKSRPYRHGGKKC